MRPNLRRNVWVARMVLNTLDIIHFCLIELILPRRLPVEMRFRSFLGDCLLHMNLMQQVRQPPVIATRSCRRHLLHHASSLLSDDLLSVDDGDDAIGGLLGNFLRAFGMQTVFRSVAGRWARARVADPLAGQGLGDCAEPGHPGDQLYRTPEVFGVDSLELGDLLLPRRSVRGFAGKMHIERLARRANLLGTSADAIGCACHQKTLIQRTSAAFLVRAFFCCSTVLSSAALRSAIALARCSGVSDFQFSSTAASFPA